MATYVKVMLGLPLSSASRNKHELSAAYEAGYNVVVFCGEGGFPEEEELRRYKIICRRTLEAEGGNRIEHWINILREWFRFGRELKREKPDVISCHNLTNLLPVWAVTRFMFPRPKLIYDSHEFMLFEAFSRRTSKQQKKVRRREKFLMSRCAFSIMVNDSIADAVAEEYHLKERPVVIRSTPIRWKLDTEIMAEKRRMMCEKLGAGKEAFLAIYHGLLNKNRGVEKLIRALVSDTETYAVFMGYGETGEFQSLARELGVEKRVLFLPAVPGDLIWQYVGAADVGVMPIQNVCRSYYLSLPNKFFETVQSLTPLICSEFPEMERLVKKYEIGLLCDPADPEALAYSLKKMRTDREFYALCKENLIRAKDELCWENEKKALLEAFHRYL